MADGGATGLPHRESVKALLNVRVVQIAVTLYSINSFCRRPSTLSRHASGFAQVREHFISHMDYYRANNNIVSFFDFVWKLVDIWVPLER